MGLIVFNVYSDSFKYNLYNNHGVVGLVNMPTARFFDESVYGFTIYDGTPDQKITMTSNPFDWLEASFFYTNLQNMPYPGYESQDYKDKGFNFKIRLKEEGKLPSLALGINDIAGTGFYSSEYIVASYGVKNIDFHAGLGWGLLNGSDSGKTNPFSHISSSFDSRPNINETKGSGGQFDFDRYFSGKTVSPFFGISYAPNDSFIFKFEKDTTSTDGRINFDNPKSDYSYSLNYLVNKNFSLGIANERGSYLSLSFTYKNNPKETIKKYKYKNQEKISKDDSKFKKLVKNIENNNIGVNKILESENLIGLELTQFAHSDIGIVEEIIASSAIDSDLKKEIKKDLRIANLVAVKEYDSNFENNANLIYERKKERHFNTNTGIKFRPFLAAREGFLKGALLLENDSEFIITDSLFFSSNIKYSIADNFDDLIIPPEDVYPAQVRSDVKDYLRSFDEGVVIGRAQFDYHITPKKNHHLMFTSGILEEMFSGTGIEYLFFDNEINYAFGFEIFDVRKRDYKMRFGKTNYQNTIGFANLYVRNYRSIPFDMKLSFGEYLAGDEGATIDFSRSFENGTKFGFFATFTDVSSEDFGEGSFDKGVYFDIPIYQNFVNYTWRPLLKILGLD